MKKRRILLLLSMIGIFTLSTPAITANAEWVNAAAGKMYRPDVSSAYVTGLNKIDEFTYYFNEHGIMQTGFQTIGQDRYYFNALGQMQVGRFVASDGKTYYGDKTTGILATNKWIKKRYYQADGSMAVNTWIDGKYVGSNGRYTKTGSSTGWVTKGSLKYYYTENGVLAKGKVLIDGKLYYFDTATGAMRTGWFKVGKKYYYADSKGVLAVNKWKDGKYLKSNGAAATGKNVISGTTYLFTSSGSKCSGWSKYKKVYYYCIDGVVQQNTWVDNNKYYVLANGARALGWQNIGDDTYYFHPSSGVRTTGRVKIGAYRYFFDSHGRLCKGTWAGSKKYFASASGALLTGLQNINGSLYFFKANGKKVTNKLKTINSATYYFTKTGAAAQKTWVKIDSDYYYFQKDGQMVKNKWVGSWYVDLSGARTNETKKTGWQTVGDKTYYYTKKGAMVLGWKIIDENKYYFDPGTGEMYTGLQTVDNMKHYFYTDGRLATSITIAVGLKEYTIDADGVITAEKSIKISGNSTGAKIVNFALQYVGNPYVWGGTSLTAGADCSGFVQTVFANFGIKLLRVADDQMKGPSDAISQDYKRPIVVDFSDIQNMQPGDLIFYGAPTYATHVAIYMGNNQIVHASNSQPYPQGGIKISNYDYQTPVSVMRYWS